MSKGLLLVGEPMGLLIAKQEGALETVRDNSTLQPEFQDLVSKFHI